MTYSMFAIHIGVTVNNECMRLISQHFVSEGLSGYAFARLCVCELYSYTILFF